MQRGRPRKTAEQKRLSGTAQPCRILPEDENTRPAAEALTYVPPVPTHLAGHPHASDQWTWLAPLLVRNGSLAEQDLNTLANLCLTQGQIIAAALGEITEPRGIHARYKQYGAALGLAPAWRQRVKISDDNAAPKNPFEAFKGRSN